MGDGDVSQPCPCLCVCVLSAEVSCRMLRLSLAMVVDALSAFGLLISTLPSDSLSTSKHSPATVV